MFKFIAVVVLFGGCVCGQSTDPETLTTPLLSEPGPYLFPITTGTRKHVYLFVNHHYIAINETGTISGLQVNESNSTVWHRIALSDGSILLRSSAQCTYACINECGYVYSAVLPTNECVWSETYNEFDYRFISKTFGDRVAYLAVNVQGKTRKLMTPKNETVGDKVDTVHIFIKPYSGIVDFSKTCKVANTKRLSYIPKKTCKSLARHKHPKRAADETEGNKNNTVTIDSDESHVNTSLYTSIPTELLTGVVVNATINNTMSSPLPPLHVNTSSVHVVNETIYASDFIKNTIPIVNASDLLHKMATASDKVLIQTNEIPVINNVLAENETTYVEGVNKRNFYDMEETLSIHTLDKPINISASIEDIIDHLLNIPVPNANATVSTEKPYAFIKHKKTVIMTQCRVL
jgi:Fibroblast growth factor